MQRFDSEGKREIETRRKHTQRKKGQKGVSHQRNSSGQRRPSTLILATKKQQNKQNTNKKNKQMVKQS